MIRHQILLRFRDEVTENAKAQLFDEMRAIANGFDGVTDFQTRVNISPEKTLVRGLYDIFWFDIRDEPTRDIFLQDAAHLEVAGRIVDLIEGGLDGVTVADYYLNQF